MVANSAHKLMARLRRRSATTSAAHRIASERGRNSLIALLRVEMESRGAPITSPALLLMVAWNAHAVTIRVTPYPAMMAHALSIVLASGQPGRIVPRNVVAVRRRPGS